MFAEHLLHAGVGPGISDRLDTPVRDLMRPGVIVLADDASVQQAHRALLAHGVHAVLVLERGGARPIGWITSTGLLAWCDRDIGLASARDAVTEPATAVEPSASAREVLAILKREGLSRVLVARVSDGLPEGVVADVDLLRLLAR